jgi:hypothetical protein
MGMHEPEKRKAMAGLSMDNKWQLIYQHESQEQTKVRKQDATMINCTMSPSINLTDGSYIKSAIGKETRGGLHRQNIARILCAQDAIGC